jgi:hypothetical protein
VSYPNFWVFHIEWELVQGDDGRADSGEADTLTLVTACMGVWPLLHKEQLQNSALGRVVIALVGTT